MRIVVLPGHHLQNVESTTNIQMANNESVAMVTYGDHDNHSPQLELFVRWWLPGTEPGSPGWLELRTASKETDLIEIMHVNKCHMNLVMIKSKH